METITLQRHFSRRLTAAYAISFVLALLIGFLWGFPLMGQEEGPLENAQEIALLLASGLFFLAAFRLSDAARMTAIGAGALSVIFYFRELELPVTGAITAYLDSDMFRWHETILLFVLLLPYVLLRRQHLPAQWHYVRRGTCWPFLVAGAWLLIGDALDKFAHNTTGAFFEEWAELNCYLTLLLIAHAFAGRVKKSA